MGIFAPPTCAFPSRRSAKRGGSLCALVLRQAEKLGDDLIQRNGTGRQATSGTPSLYFDAALAPSERSFFVVEWISGTRSPRCSLASRGVVLCGRPVVCFGLPFF